MAKYIDEKLWWETLCKPDWYIKLSAEFNRLEEFSHQKDEQEAERIRDEAYAIVEKAVRENHVSIGHSDGGFDKERKPIDTIVIHHTKNPPGITLEWLNAMQLLRIYGRYFANPSDEREQYLKGKKISSGHYYKKQQVFWGYHWLVRNGGVVERILEDKNVGWHAGNWDINTRSVGICVDDDLSKKEPSEAILKAMAIIVQEHYSKVSKERIIGHCDVNKNTECPGRLFRDKWREKLLEELTNKNEHV